MATPSDEAVAHYFAEDLLQLANTANIDLATEFQIPLPYSRDPRDIVNLVAEDIAHMLRNDLITGIHLVISDCDMDKGTNTYKVRYHVHYRVNINILGAFPFMNDVRRRVLDFSPPGKVWRNARFALLIDWNPSVRNTNYQVRRPHYCLDWVAEENRFDVTNLIDYREGHMLGDGAEVVSREESTSLEHHRDII